MWLELFILFHMRGGNAVATEPAARRHLRATHASSFRAFQCRSRVLFQFASDAVKPSLRPHLVRHAGNRQPLARYGLLANFAQLPFRLRLGDALLHAALCSYSGRVPSATLVPARLRSARFKAPRFSPWEFLATTSALPDAATRLLSSQSVEHDQDQQHYHEQLSRQWFLLRCHWCKAASDMQHRTLYMHGTCKHLVCCHCKKGASAAKWQCECGVPWVTCTRCRPLGFLCRSGRLKRLMAIDSESPPPPPTKKLRFSAGFRVRGNPRGNSTTTKRARRKAHRKRHGETYGPSRLTREGCSVVGSKRPCEPTQGSPSVSSDVSGSLAALPAPASSFASAA